MCTSYKYTSCFFLSLNFGFVILLTKNLPTTNPLRFEVLSNLKLLLQMLVHSLTNLLQECIRQLFHLQTLNKSINTRAICFKLTNFIYQPATQIHTILLVTSLLVCIV